MVGIVKVPTSSAKQRKKQKPDKATRELMEAHAQLLNKWARMPKFAFTKFSRKPSSKPAVEPMVDAPRPPSRVTPGGSTALKPSPVYTGTKVIGIADMHKSNAVPVFSQEEAIDISRMRRN